MAGDRGRLTVELTGDGDAAPGGIAVFDGRSRVLLAWQALGATALPCAVHFDGVPSGPLLVAHALGREAARDGSFQQRAVEAARPASVPRVVQLDGRTATVSVAIDGDLGTHEALLVIERVGEPRWVAPAPVRADDGRWVLPPLGSGRYRIRLRGLRGEPPPPVEFTVPGTSRVTVPVAAADAADPDGRDGRSPTTPDAGRSASAGR